MNIQPEALGSLFEMSRDAVWGIEDNVISFVNPVAETVLALRPGMSVKGFLPDYILSDTSEHITAFLDLNGQQANVSINRQEGFSLVCAVFPEESSSVSGFPPPAEELAASLMAAKISIDTIIEQTNAEGSPPLKDYACALYRSYYRMKRLCEHMGAAANMQRDILPCNDRVEDLEELCRDLCDSVDKLVGERISIRFHAEPGDYFTQLDADQIEVMLLNLMSNSIAHMPSGGVIEIALARHGNRFVISVKDNGVGIDPAKLSGLAPRSLTDTTSGVGLGLRVASGIARRHGGALIIDTTPGRGASVRISLPLRVSDVLKSPPVSYQSKSMNNILTELSTVLDKSHYERKFRE
ncbi:MAG: ATP-binding protein [Oscillospiraceae bacterium]|nr:ATP-binding protein [Oscillospiraceae bacterium]